MEKKKNQSSFSFGAAAAPRAKMTTHTTGEKEIAQAAESQEAGAKAAGARAANGQDGAASTKKSAPDPSTANHVSKSQDKPVALLFQLYCPLGSMLS